MFAPTFSLEKVGPSAPTDKCTKSLRSRLCDGASSLAKAPALLIVTCALTLGFSLGAQAQNVVIQGPSSAITEGSGGGTTINADFRVSLSQPPTADSTVTVQTVAGTATAGQDFTPVTTVLTFLKGDTGPQTISVPIVSDDLYEVGTGGSRNETFSLQVTGTTGAVPSSTASAQASIADDDPAPVVTIDDRPDIVEGNNGTQNVNFTVSLSGAAGQDTTFTYATAPDSSAGNNAATPDVDYVNVSRTGTILAGMSQTQITVQVIGDKVDETDEGFAVNLSNARSGGQSLAIADAQAIGTILDDDGPQVSISNARATEGNNLTFQVTLSAASPDTVTLNYDFADNSAVNGQDYTGTPGTVTFGPGDTVQEITVPTINDLVFEGTEVFTVNLSGESGGTTVTDRQGIGTIDDDEAPPTVSVNDVRQTEGTGANSTFDFTATLSSASTQRITVRYHTSNGSATAPSDYTSTAGTLAFAAGETTKTVSVTVVGDSRDEPDEKFNVIFSNATPTGTTFSNGSTSLTATGTIIDDDGPTFSFESDTVTTTEGNTGSRTTAPFYVKLSAASATTVSVRFAITAGTATFRTDFTRSAGATGTLTFSPGITRLPINVDIIGDNVDEPDENFTIALSNATGGTISVSQGTTTGVIRDDDAAPVISINNVSSTEGNSGTKSFNFSVSLDRPSAQSVTVDYATADVTATGGTDYQVTSGTALFNPGVTKQTISVPVIGDTLDEADSETFSVILTNPTNSTLSSRAKVGTGTINDDDKTPQLSIVSGPISRLEGDIVPANGTPVTFLFTVSLTNSSGGITPSGRDVTFRYQTVQQTAPSGQLLPATEGIDYNGASGNASIPAGQSSVDIPVTVIGDTLDEADEYFKIVISQPQNAAPKPRVSTSTGIILDDDKEGSVSIKAPAADDAAIEPGYFTSGQNAVFPVTLSAAAGRDVVVTYAIESSGNTNQANPSADLGVVDANGKIQNGQTTGTITIPAGSTTANIIVAPINDALDEPDLENYRVRLTDVSPSGYTIAGGTGTGGNGGTGGTGAGTAVSTIADRDAGFTSFTPKEGNQAYNPAQTNATKVTITGDQFTIDGVDQIRSVVFGFNGTSRTVSTSDFTVNSATQITVEVPQGARSGLIRLITNDGVTLSPSASRADTTFFVNAVVTGFTPDRGVERNTVVVITGVNFDDPLNPITGVRFNGTASNVRTAGVDFQIFTEGGQRKIRATVPVDATSGPITLVTSKGTMYPPSTDSFTVDGVSVGGVRFAESGTFATVENARGDVANSLNPKPVLSFTLELKPALENVTQDEIAPRGQITVRVIIKDDVTAGQRVRFPRISVPTGRVTQVDSQTFDVTFDAGAFQSKTINVIDTGDDIIEPAFVAGGFFQEQTPRLLTLSAFIKTSNTVDSTIYPVNSMANDITIQRNDLHGLDTDIGTTLRTTEDQSSPNNITEFKLNLRNINNGVDVSQPDAFGDGVGVATRKYSNKPQPPVLNPDGTINTDAEPDSDVFLPFTVSKPANLPEEALIRYYVRIPTGPTTYRKVYPDDAVFRTTTTVRYGTNPDNDEYYKYDHYIEVKGQDDDLQDGSQSYQITLDQGTAQNPIQNSVDPEFFALKLVTPFTLTNADNEQSTGAGEPGFIFSRSSGTPLAPQLTTSEAGRTDFFTARLRTRPSSGKVTLRFQTSNPSEVLLLDPSDPTGNTRVETLDLVFYADSQSSYKANESRWDTPQTVRVVGVNDNNLDSAQRVFLISSTVDNLTDDPTYDTIDPVDPVVINLASSAVTVSQTTLNVDEGSTQTFTVVLNARPGADVVINLSSSDPTVAVATTGGNSTRLTFTPDNYNVPQTVTVRGVADSGFNQRSATILLSRTSSADSDFDQLDVPDVQVNVQDVSQAYIITPTTATTMGLSTSEDGDTDNFSVRLINAPTANVVITLSVSNPNEAQLSFGGQKDSTIQLTFTPSNYATAQKVTVIGLDDTAQDGNQSYTIFGSVSTTDTTYKGQPFPSILGVNRDNDGTSTGNSITFAANGTYNVSFPYAAGTTASSTLTPAQAFSPSSGFTLYKFNVTGQRNSRSLTTGTDFVAVGASEKLVRGIGYRLVTGSSAVTLNVPATSSALKAYSGTTFPLTLSWNPTFLDDTPYKNNLNNGYNFIGFPFDPSKYSAVNFENSTVTYGSQTYNSIADASAAGVIDQQLYTVDAQGNLTSLSSTDRIIRPYRAYFVRILRNDQTVTLTLKAQ